MSYHLTRTEKLIMDVMDNLRTADDGLLRELLLRIGAEDIKLINAFRNLYHNGYLFFDRNEKTWKMDERDKADDGLKKCLGFLVRRICPGPDDKNAFTKGCIIKNTNPRIACFLKGCVYYFYYLEEKEDADQAEFFEKKLLKKGGESPELVRAVFLSENEKLLEAVCSVYKHALVLVTDDNGAIKYDRF